MIVKKNEADDVCEDEYRESCDKLPEQSHLNRNRPLRNKLSFLHWNVAGLMTKIHDCDFVDYIYNFDIICLVETFITELNQCCFNKEYEVFVKPAVKLSKQGRQSGGILCLFRKSLLPLIKNI